MLFSAATSSPMLTPNASRRRTTFFLRGLNGGLRYDSLFPPGEGRGLEHPHLTLHFNAEPSVRNRHGRDGHPPP